MNKLKIILYYSGCLGKPDGGNSGSSTFWEEFNFIFRVIFYFLKFWPQ